MTTRELLVPKGSKRRKGNKLKSVRGVTIHNTGNTSKGANADANARYQKNSANDAVNGWHWTVDEKEAVLSIPEDEIAEHAGNRNGNDTTVAIEICENVDGDLAKATENGAYLAAQILKRQGFTKAVSQQNIFMHYHLANNKKRCPSRILNNEPYGWDEFVRRVNAYMSGSAVQPTSPTPAPTTSTTKPSTASNGLPDGVFYYRLKTKERTYFRSAPVVKSSNIMTTLNANTNLKYRGESGDYYKVSTEAGKIGYVAKKLVTPNYYGSKTDVKAIQSALKVTADGLYGYNTAKAVEAVQRSNGLTVDGIYGPNTRAAMMK